MFDLSFGKLILVLIIGLVVLGPARLPEAIKTVAGWIKALRRISASVQLELNKELKLQELQDSLKKAEKSGLTSITPEIQASIDDLKRVTESLQKDFYNTKEDVKSQVNQIGDQLQQIDLSKQLDLAHDDAESIKTIDNKPSSAPIGKDDHVR